MKAILTVLLFTICLTTSGQGITAWTDGHASWAQPAKYDTTAVIMLASDTTKHQSMDLIYYQSEGTRLREEQPAFWIRGYHVTKSYQKFGQESVDGGNSLLIHNGEWYTDHIAYLNSEKKPLNYLVWISKEIK